MMDKEKQQYVEAIKAKAIAYAENALSDIKGFMPDDEYKEAVRDFSQAFICGADAAVATIKEIKA